jgi:hypothetical protein
LGHPDGRPALSGENRPGPHPSPSEKNAGGSKGFYHYQPIARAIGNPTQTRERDTIRPPATSKTTETSTMQPTIHETEAMERTREECSAAYAQSQMDAIEQSGIDQGIANPFRVRYVSRTESTPVRGGNAGQFNPYPIDRD